MEDFTIYNQRGEPLYVAKINCLNGATGAVKLGLAVVSAYLRGANLSGANLSGAYLKGAYLKGANLMGANLSGVDLSGANLGGANLMGANLMGADLWGANLGGANLSGAYLEGANLSGANLSGAYLWDTNLEGAILPTLVAAKLLITPEGDLIGWKKCQMGVLVKLLIPSSSPRHNATGRKCRAKFATVLEVFGGEIGISTHDGKTTYRVGETVTCDFWEEDRWKECAGGIHFFLTKEEAEAY